jgi:hypothetical protein
VRKNDLSEKYFFSPLRTVVGTTAGMQRFLFAIMLAVTVPAVHAEKSARDF